MTLSVLTEFHHFHGALAAAIKIFAVAHFASFAESAFFHDASRGGVIDEKVAKEWSELNKVEITPQMINCTGCRIEGPKTPFCQSLCPIRKCAQGKGFATCGECNEVEHCETLSMITSHNDYALSNLKSK